MEARTCHKLSRCPGWQPVISSGLPVAAARMAKVPASIRSGITRQLPPLSEDTPSISMVWVPAPFILAPQAFRNPASALISGSQAQFFRTVRPPARAAAIISDSVPVTLTELKKYSAPWSFLALIS
jgi:hypothetical protein